MTLVLRSHASFDIMRGTAPIAVLQAAPESDRVRLFVAQLTHTYFVDVCITIASAGGLDGRRTPACVITEKSGMSLWGCDG